MLVYIENGSTSFCIRIESNSQKTFYCIVLFTNMAAVTSDENPFNILRVSEFAIPRFTTKKYGKHSLTYLGPKLWNGLPGEIRSQLSRQM